MSQVVVVVDVVDDVAVVVVVAAVDVVDVVGKSRVRWFVRTIPLPPQKNRSVGNWPKSS